MTPTSDRPIDNAAWMCETHQLALDWRTRSTWVALSSLDRTPAYIDLHFALGFAWIGKADEARELLGRAEQALVGAGDAHSWLHRAFEFRIQQVLGGKAPSGALPAEHLESLERVERLERYVVDRLRKHSSILEPHQRINPYRHWGARINEFEKALAELSDLTNPDEIVSRVDKLLGEIPNKGTRRGDEQKARVLRAGLEASPRVGEEFARKLLDQTVPTYDKLPEAREMAPLMEQACLLEKAIFIAGHFGLAEATRAFVARFQRMLRSSQGAMIFQVLEGLARSVCQSLRKLGMRDEIDQILRQMAEMILQGHDVKAIDFKKEEHGPAALCSLLQVAAQWFCIGETSEAEPILQVAREILLSNDLPARDQTKLAKAYAAALGEAPVPIARQRLEEMLRELKGIKDTYTTSSHFSVSQLDVVESVVLTAVEVCSRR